MYIYLSQTYSKAFTLLLLSTEIASVSIDKMIDFSIIFE